VLIVIGIVMVISGCLISFENLQEVDLDMGWVGSVEFYVR
jgi:hypothetical protein